MDSEKIWLNELLVNAVCDVGIVKSPAYVIIGKWNARGVDIK